MPSPKPLPAAFSDRAFAVPVAVASGVTVSRLRAGDLDAPFHGVRAPLGRTRSFRDHVRAALPRLRPGDYFSHLAALALVGADVIGSQHSPVDVSSLSPLARVRARGFRGHEIGAESVRLGAVGGVPAVHPVDAWCQLAVHASVTELVLVGDALVRRRKPIAQRDDLRDRTDSPVKPACALRRSIMASRNRS